MALEFLDPNTAVSVHCSLPGIRSKKPVPGKLIDKVPDLGGSCEVKSSVLDQLGETPFAEDIRCDKCFTSFREKSDGRIRCCMCEQCFCIHCASGLVDQFSDGTKLHSSWWDNRANLFPPSLMHELREFSTFPQACKGCMRFICHNCVASAPWCACSYCAENYTCVGCFKPNGLHHLCRRHQESEKRRQLKQEMEEEFLHNISELAHMAVKPTAHS